MENRNSRNPETLWIRRPRILRFGIGAAFLLLLLAVGCGAPGEPTPPSPPRSPALLAPPRHHTRAPPPNSFFPPKKNQSGPTPPQPPPPQKFCAARSSPTDRPIANHFALSRRFLARFSGNIAPPTKCKSRIASLRMSFAQVMTRPSPTACALARLARAHPLTRTPRSSLSVP